MTKPRNSVDGAAFELALTRADYVSKTRSEKQHHERMPAATDVRKIEWIIGFKPRNLDKAVGFRGREPA